jgi:hypothetical protein
MRLEPQHPHFTEVAVVAVKELQQVLDLAAACRYLVEVVVVAVHQLEVERVVLPYTEVMGVQVVPPPLKARMASNRVAAVVDLEFQLRLIQVGKEEMGMCELLHFSLFLCKNICPRVLISTGRQFLQACL